jgi:kinesin family protein 20
MKFAALAREVYITPAPAPMHKTPVVGPGKTVGKTIKKLGPLTLNDPDIAPRPFTRKIHISVGGPGTGRKQVDKVLEVHEGRRSIYFVYSTF